VGFGSYIEKDVPDEGETVKDPFGIFAWQVKAGVALFLNDHVSIDLGLGYQNLSVKPKEDNDANYRNLYGGINFEAGIIVVL
jgi:opacity protein-like surface antigen